MTFNLCFAGRFPGQSYAAAASATGAAAVAVLGVRVAFLAAGAVPGAPTFREYAFLQVRADAMGLTNTPHFGPPNSSCAGSGSAPGPVAGSGGLCAGSNFGVITGFVEPGGFFGQEPGNRVVWLGTEVKF